MLLEKINADLIKALKNKDKIRVSTLRMICAAIKNKEIEKNKKLEDSDIISIIKNSVKQHKESIEQFKKGNREDLVAQEEAELRILADYLPEQLSSEDIEKIVKEKIKTLNLEFKKDMGIVMKEIMAEHKDTIEGKLLKDIVLKNLK